MPMLFQVTRYLLLTIYQDVTSMFSYLELKKYSTEPTETRIQCPSKLFEGKGLDNTTIKLHEANIKISQQIQIQQHLSLIPIIYSSTLKSDHIILSCSPVWPGVCQYYSG